MLPLETVVKQFHGKSRWAHLEWSNYRNFMVLARRGIFVAFADSVVYHRKAFLFVGSSEAGKTTLTGNIVRYNPSTSRRLSEDSTTIVYDDQRLYSYQTSCGVNADLMPILDQKERYAVAAIFHLVAENTVEKSGINVNSHDCCIDETLRQMFFSYQNAKVKSCGAMDTTRTAFEGLPVIVVPQEDTPKERYLKVVSMMKEYLD
jgi:hypothetical protein